MTIPRRLAITQRVVEHDAYVERRDALAQDWAAWLTDTFAPTAGVPVPNNLDDVTGWAEAVDAGGLILSGGNNWGEAPERDRTERALVDWFRERGRPVLGVCRGLHVLNVVFGGTITPTIGRATGTTHAAHDHPVTLTADPFRSWTPTGEMVVNSYHDQGVLVEQLAEGLRPFAVADGGLVEGFVHEEEPIAAIQWHPERPDPAAPFDRRLIGALFSEGTFWGRR